MPQNAFREKLGRQFVINVEVVPPAVPVCEDLIRKITSSLPDDLPIDGLNLADSPMACPRMSPLMFASAVRHAFDRPIEIIPHVTIRDRNRVALRGLIWGAVAVGIETILVVSGDPVQYSNDPQTRHVGDLTVADMVRLAVEAGLLTGVVMDPRAERRDQELRKLETKLEAGAGFVITQPLYDARDLDAFARTVEPLGVPVLLGILPLVSPRHARFLDERVPGIGVPAEVIQDMDAARDKAVDVGLAVARDMLQGARGRLAGACIMPPFERFHLVADLLRPLEYPLSLGTQGLA